MKKDTKKPINSGSEALAGKAMSYAEAANEVEYILEHQTLSFNAREALTICKNAAIKCAAREAITGGHHPEKRGHRAK
jgi:hypothetical protein